MITSEIYKTLKPFEYDPNDFSEPIYMKKKSIQIITGQFKLKTGILEGIGIIVYKDGSIQEGHWKNGELHGSGRVTTNINKI